LEGLAQAHTEKSRREALIWTQRFPLVLLCGLFVNIAVSFLLTILFGRSITSRLRILNLNISRVAKREEPLPLVGGRDEIGDLERSFHHMTRTLASMESQMAAMVNNVTDVILTLSKSGQVQEVSPAVERQWGYQRLEMINTNLISLMPEDDAAEMARQLDLASSRGEFSSFESRIKKSDGSTLSMLWSIHWSSTEEIMFCVAHDITSRKVIEQYWKISERHSRHVIDGLPVALLEIAPDGKIHMVNPPMEALCGYPREELLGKVHTTLFDGESMTDLLDDSKSRRCVVERQLTSIQGVKIPVEVTISSIKTGGVEQTLIALTDLSERHEVERLKQEFLNTISNDLRAPLTSIQTLQQRLLTSETGTMTDRQSDTLHKANQQVGHLIRLISDLLDVQRMESGKFTVDLNSVNVSELIKHSVEAVRGQATKYDIDIRVSEREAFVRGDFTRLTQVITNLLSNAIKFSARGSAIEVNIVDTDDKISLEVVDYGRGIPKERLETIFEKYGQVERADVTKRGGTGLGLAICQMIVEQHRGEIAVESEP
ncbi:MAG: PAS domain S-box protein, partial [Cyanobacteria bacterium]|nr:PAS domain S-box protein [Cyanobacteriota bacterium]